MFTASKAREWIVTYSLSITCILMILFAMSQQIGIRFNYGKGENLRLIDIFLPTFLGYLGSASSFIFKGRDEIEIPPDRVRLIKILIHGPFLVFSLFSAALIFAYYQTHLPQDPNALRVQPMPYEDLGHYLSVGLGLLMATTSTLSAYLFQAGEKRSEHHQEVGK